MNAYEIIDKKKHGHSLSDDEIAFMVNGFSGGGVSEGQMAAFLMAVCLKGMDSRETASMTMTMAHSGDVMDLSSINGIKVDKHSTGGVGDKTSLIAVPVAACAGVKIAKMSGRGLGHTGGTVDKLESIPGLKTVFSSGEFIDIVNKTGVCIAGQSGLLAPADKKIYALRDVTATVDSIPLIASSIMSKKIAAGSDAILLDVKTGTGAFMKTVEEAAKLAAAMVSIGESAGKKTVALITDMDTPLGNAIGNSLEVMECVETLKGGGPDDLTAVCVELAANMILLGGCERADLSGARAQAADIIQSGAALGVLAALVEAQGGDKSYVHDTGKFGKSPVIGYVTAESDGFITSINAEALGRAAVVLGAGREVADAPVDFDAGIMLLLKTGDIIKKGDAWAEIHTSDKDRLSEGMRRLNGAISISGKKPEQRPLILARVDTDGVHPL